MQCRVREACLRVQPRGCLREVRVEKDREAHVALRHGQVFERAFVEFLKRLKLRLLLVLVLRGMPLKLAVRC